MRDGPFSPSGAHCGGPIGVSEQLGDGVDDLAARTPVDE
jgi:hypothetical protein